jgi:hypothetical protein
VPIPRDFTALLHDSNAFAARDYIHKVSVGRGDFLGFTL